MFSGPEFEGARGPARVQGPQVDDGLGREAEADAGEEAGPALHHGLGLEEGDGGEGKQEEKERIERRGRGSMRRRQLSCAKLVFKRLDEAHAKS